MYFHEYILDSDKLHLYYQQLLVGSCFLDKTMKILHLQSLEYHSLQLLLYILQIPSGYGCLQHHIPAFLCSRLMPMDRKFLSAGFFHHTRIRWFLQVLPFESGCRFHHKNSGCRHLNMHIIEISLHIINPRTYSFKI